jgi:hypothetical protein
MQFVIKSVSAGEPTEILASLTRQEVVGIDKLGTALSQTLLLSGKEIDVTPADSGTTKSKKPGSVMHEVPMLSSLAPQQRHWTIGVAEEHDSEAILRCRESSLHGVLRPSNGGGNVNGN